MPTTQAEPLPYGIRNVTLTKYTDGSGTVLGATSQQLTYMQTLTFSEAETFKELRGDDRLIAIRGQGAQVDWQLDAGGINYLCWEILSGGATTETGTTPNRITKYRKMAISNPRPYFRTEGQSISDSGGDLHAMLYRCRCNSTVDGSFKDGEFFITSCKGIALPLINSLTFDLLYEFFQYETITTPSLTPSPNPTS